MSLLKYFQLSNSTLPKADGPLSQVIPSCSITAPNKEVKQVLDQASLSQVWSVRELHCRIPAGKVELVQRRHPKLPCTCGSLERPSQQCSCSSCQIFNISTNSFSINTCAISDHTHTQLAARRMHQRASAKVFSAKFYFPPIRESFLPRKFSAIR